MLENALVRPCSALNAIKILKSKSNVGKLILGPGVYTVLLKAMTNLNPEVRYEAADGLGAAQTNANVVVPALRRALGDPDFRVRAEAAISLGGPGFKDKTSEIVPALIPLLGDTNSFVRRFTSIRLGLYRANATNALPILKRLVIDENDSDAKEAELRAIQRIEQNYY
jgi:HEAT repeat protein